MRKKKIKILHVAQAAGGVDRYIRMLLKYLDAQAQDMRNEQRRVYREMKTVAERANYSEYNESNQLMESVDILHRVFGY